MQIEIPIERIQDFCRRWKIAEFALFGSVLREDFRPDSDVDVLVTFEPNDPWSYWEWPDMMDEFESMVVRKVDLVEKAALKNPFRRDGNSANCQGRLCRHSEDRNLPRLRDMLMHGRLAMKYVEGQTYQRYQSDDQLQAAVERRVEIVGEAARHITAEFQRQHPDVPWRIIAAQRHIIAHDYGEIIHERIWRVATVHIPELLAQIEKILPPSMQ